MSVKQNRTTTANTGAPSTREKAAGKQQPAIREEFLQEIRELRKIATTLSNRVYKAAIKAIQLQATEEEYKALLKEIPKQRRAEFNRLVSAPGEHWGDKAPSNLSKCAKYLQYRAEGASDSEAAQWAEKGKPAAKKGPDSRKDPAADAPEPAADAPEPAAPKPVESESPLAMIERGLAQLEKDYKGDKTVQSAVKTVRTAMGKVSDHVAKVKAHNAT